MCRKGSAALQQQLLLATKTHNVVETLGGTETSRSHANDEDVNLTEDNSLADVLPGAAASRDARKSTSRARRRGGSRTYVSAGIVTAVGGVDGGLKMQQRQRCCD